MAENGSKSTGRRPPACAKELQRAGADWLDGAATDPEREALALLGVRTARQLARLNDASAIGLAKLLKFAELSLLNTPGALSAEVQRVEAQYGVPFLETPVAQRLELNGGPTGSRTLSLTSGAYTGSMITESRNGPITLILTPVDAQAAWRARGMELVARMRSWALVPKSLRPLAKKIQSTFGGNIDAIRELASHVKTNGQASINHVKAIAEDRAMLPKAVELFLAGEPTKVVATQLRIGILRAKRIRALAVSEGRVPPRARRREL